VTTPDEIVEGHVGPVWVETLSPYFFSEAHEAAQAAWDDGLEPTTLVAVPCLVRKAHTPDLREHVEETWWCEYDDPDPLHLPKRVIDALAEAQRLCDEAAPDVWEPMPRKRVILPPVQCPDCGRASNEPWDDLAPDCSYCGRPNEADEQAPSGAIVPPETDA
jgi:hypothetical protein